MDARARAPVSHVSIFEFRNIRAGRRRRCRRLRYAQPAHTRAASPQSRTKVCRNPKSVPERVLYRPYAAARPAFRMRQGNPGIPGRAARGRPATCAAAAMNPRRAASATRAGSPYLDCPMPFRDSPPVRHIMTDASGIIHARKVSASWFVGITLSATMFLNEQCSVV